MNCACGWRGEENILDIGPPTGVVEPASSSPNDARPSLPARRVFAVAVNFRRVGGLAAVLAAIFPIRTVFRRRAAAAGMRALFSLGHDSLLTLQSAFRKQHG
jgi:hypothetical protein